MALLDELLVAVGMQTDDLTDGAAGAADDVEKSLGGIAAGAAGGLVGAAFVAGMDSAMDMAEVQGRLERQLDLTEAEAARAGEVAGDVYADGWGESMGEVGESMRSVISNVGELGETTDEQLTEMTKGAIALSDTFEFDVAESAQAAGELMKSGMAADGEEAFDLITAAAQELPPALAEEIPVLTREYAGFFDQLGVTGPQMMGLLTEAAENPLFEIDKLADAVKEFSLRMADTEGVSDPLDELGIDIADIQEQIDSGQGTAAFDEVVESLAGVESQADRTRLAGELMGPPGEEAGAALQALGEAGGIASADLEDFAGSMGEVVDQTEDDPAHQLTASMRSLAVELGSALLPVIQDVSGFLEEHQGLIQALAPAVLALVAAVAAFVVVQWAINFAMMANPVGLLVVAIGLLIAAIVMIVTKTTFFQDAWDILWEAVGKAWDWIWEKLKQGFKMLTDLFFNFTGPGLIIKHWDSITGTIGGAIDWITGAVGDGIGWVEDRIDDLSEIPGKIVGFFVDLGADIADPIWQGFRDGINDVIGGWNGLSFALPSVDLGPMGSIGGWTLGTPDVAYLAEGALVTGPTLAMVGEGREDEAVLPLSRLDSMLRSVAEPVRRAGDHTRSEVTIRLEGDRDLVRMFRRGIRDRGGDVTVLGQGEG